jgi:hypothetical protein
MTFLRGQCINLNSAKSREAPDFPCGIKRAEFCLDLSASLKEKVFHPFGGLLVHLR